MSLNSKLKNSKKENKKGLGFSPAFFVIESIIFLATQLLGLYTAWKLYNIPEMKEIIEEQDISIVRFLIIFFIGTATLFILTKVVKRKGIFGVFFYLMIFFGSLVFFDTYFPIYITLSLAILLPVVRYFYPNVLTQNLAIVISIIGASVYLGLGLSSMQVMVLLIVLSVYDVIAVHFSGHMVSMFKNMAKGGAIFSLIIPSKFKYLGAKIKGKGVKTTGDFMYLGTGDLAFPLIFSASLIKENIVASFFVIFGSFLGVNLIYFYFYITKTRK
ncbi:MAG: hypothetical protein HQ538_05340, partial [Parcubacteria group bacterium]|nr:hypothetical protein [Parcubacteria group bacterium]